MPEPTPMERLILTAWNRGDLEEHARLVALDARVRARRSADAIRAGLALDDLLKPRAAYDTGWQDGYAASQEHHNGHYGAGVVLA